MTELFPTEEVEQPSPRLTWMKEHMVHTRKSDSDIEEPWVAWRGYKLDLDFCLEKATYSSEQEDYRHRLICSGETEMDAIANLALENGWRLWNEC
jgi:hypothetical protein